MVKHYHDGHDDDDDDEYDEKEDDDYALGLVNDGQDYHDDFDKAAFIFHDFNHETGYFEQSPYNWAPRSNTLLRAVATYFVNSKNK